MDLEKLIKSKPLGSKKRLSLIVNYGNSERSAAAVRCLNKRERRAELMNNYNMTFKTACMIVNKEFKQ